VAERGLESLEIQRFPVGLQELLSLKGGLTPLQLSPTAQPILDLLQMYGLLNRTVGFNTNAAAAEGTAVIITPSVSSWAVLFGATSSIVKTATMTAARAALTVTRAPLSTGLVVASAECGPFGATETGVATVAWQCPYPWLLPPGSTIFATAQIIGTDATASVTVTAEYGLLT